MADKRKILVQLDADAHASVFDRVVAIDAGVDELFSYGGVKPDQVVPLVHGTIFTRGPEDLKSTAIFIGGSDVAAGEALLAKVVKAFFGPMRVSVMLDANGANTTAAAAVLAARKHVGLADSTALVLGGTGPVGQRAALLLAHEGARVRLASRAIERAQRAATAIQSARVEPLAIHGDAELAKALSGVDVVVAAGAAGATLLPAAVRKAAASLRVVIDLNAMPPLGVEGIDVTDKARERDGQIVYGAIGVGGMKMKIHKAAIAGLFEANDRVYDAMAIYELGKKM